VLINAYGLFWRADEVTWNPGRGRRRQFRLLGRRGSNRPGLRLADFRSQSGLYVLYGNYGPHYVGLTGAERLGERLKDHLSDSHRDEWDRFSWFGFRQVLKARDSEGICLLKSIPHVSLGNPDSELADMEALLIRALGLSSNRNKTKFRKAKEWIQVKNLEVTVFLEKVRR
jgi:hypothetical protein